MSDLDALCALHGTDKGSTSQRGLSPKNYHRVYERLLGSRRQEPLRLLEIGVQTGASLRVWADYLPHAQITGLDTNPKCRRHETDRVKVVVGSQSDPHVLAGLLGPWDVVIDDGSHRLDDLSASLAALLPHVEGWYAIEDLHSHEGPQRKGEAISRLAGGRDIEWATGLAVVHA